MNQEQNDLRQRFRELREQDQSTAPPFEDLLRTTASSKPTARPRRLSLVLAGAAALAWALYLRRPQPVPEPSFDEACAAALAALDRDQSDPLLRMSTDDLLPFDALSDR